MRKEFNELVSTLKRWDLYHKNDEVYIALTDLENKIDEVMKRIDCAMRSNQDSNSIVMQFVDGFQDEGLVKQTLNHIDFETLQRSVYDVDVALNLNDTECIDNNWYELFESKEELKSIEVDNIEYDFLEDVYTIGNSDNSEIIGDVYQSVFINLDKLGVIICEGDEGFKFGKANYVVKDNALIPLVIANQIDLSKVPIKKEVFMTFQSSWGEIDCDKDGNVMEIRGDEYIGDERNYLFDIEHFDLVEFGKFCESKNITMGEDEDIMSVGFWKYGGEYCEAEQDWRKEMFGEEPPTVLCKTPQTHEFVKDIIAKLKVIDVDGETMEYILKQVGMGEQMLKQLFAQSTNDEIDYLHDVRNGHA